MNQNKGLNLNTLLLTCILGIAGWNLSATIELGKKMAGMEAVQGAYTTTIADINSRLRALEEHEGHTPGYPWKSKNDNP